MTTIAANRECMAADHKVTDGDTSYRAAKIWKRGSAIVGAAGSNSAINKFRKWIDRGYKGRLPEFLEEEAAEFAAIVLNPDGLFVFDSSCVPDRIIDPFYAIGTGKQAALAAMHMGAGPQKAVEIACEVDNSTGPPVVVLKLANAS